MAESVVEAGQRLLAERAAAEAAAAQAQADQLDAEAREAELLRVGTAAIVDLLTTILTRMVAVESAVAQLQQLVVAPRVRRPVRDEVGTILYVVDEIQPTIDGA